MKIKGLWNKYTRIGLILGGAILISSVAVAMNASYVEGRVKTREVLVAAEDIKPYDKIEKKLKKREVVEAEIPEDAITDLKELQSLGLQYSGELGIAEGFPVKRSQLVSAAKSKFGSPMELNGELFVGVATDQVRSTGDYIKPGVLVDAYVYLEGDQQTPPTLITPAQNKKLKGLLVYDRQNADVKSPDQAEGRNKIPTVAILKVKPEIAADLVAYQEQGRIYLLPSGFDPKAATSSVQAEEKSGMNILDNSKKK